MGAYPLLVSLLDIGNGVLCAYAWNVGRAVEDKAFRQHEGEDASQAPSVMSQEVHRLGPRFTVVDQMSQRCQRIRSTKSSSDLRILNPIPCTYDPCQALCTTQKAKERLAGGVQGRPGRALWNNWNLIIIIIIIWIPHHQSLALTQKMALTLKPDTDRQTDRQQQQPDMCSDYAGKL